MKKFILFLVLFVCTITKAQTELVFVFFKDKPNKAAFYANPLSELSQKSLDRRAKFGIALNDQDAPIHQPYLQNIRNPGFAVTDYSKWMNGVAVNATTAQIVTLESQPFVQSVERFIKHDGGKVGIKKVNKFETFNNSLSKTDFNYGSGLAQINQVNLRPLHVSGFTGSGVTIAVIDTGFPTVDTGLVYERIRNNGQIKGGYNFIDKNEDIYSSFLNSHGSFCLGVIAAFKNNDFVGSAPDADFYLYATEDAENEFPEELIYWAEAAEEADRKGVDVITSSLGYYEFDDSRYDLLYSDMNGTTSFIARAAQIAVEKGIFVVAAAGNEARKDWKYIISPADNERVFSVGGVTLTGASSDFSSYGPNSLGKIKPDASARGTNTYLGYNDSILSGSGTSFAAPLAAGGIACLIQATQNKDPLSLGNILRKTSSLYPSTTPQKGYGILNFVSALNLAVLTTSENSKKSDIQIYPNPVLKSFNIKTNEKILSVELYDSLGRKLKNFQNGSFYTLEKFSKGIYFLKIETNKGSIVEKIIKE